MERVLWLNAVPFLNEKFEKLRKYRNFNEIENYSKCSLFLHWKVPKKKEFTFFVTKLKTKKRFTVLTKLKCKTKKSTFFETKLKREKKNMSCTMIKSVVGRIRTCAGKAHMISSHAR